MWCCQVPKKVKNALAITKKEHETSVSGDETCLWEKQEACKFDDPGVDLNTSWDDLNAVIYSLKLWNDGLLFIKALEYQRWIHNPNLSWTIYKAFVEGTSKQMYSCRYFWGLSLLNLCIVNEPFLSLKFSMHICAVHFQLFIFIQFCLLNAYYYIQ